MSTCRVRRELPYDFDELIATIAPRPVLVVEPTMDRATTPADVRQAVARARQVCNLYFASDKLTLHEPVEYTRLTGARAGQGGTLDESDPCANAGGEHGKMATAIRRK